MFLMKMDRKLRLQLFILGLIFGVGVLPVSSFKCYSCKEPECMDYKKDGKEIDCEHGCERIKSASWTERRCANTAIDVKCYKQVVKGCWDSSKPELGPRINQCKTKLQIEEDKKKQEASSTEGPAGPPDDTARTTASGFRCICTEDLCNGEIDLSSVGTFVQACSGGGGGTSGNGGTGTGGGSGGGTDDTTADPKAGNSTGVSLRSDKYSGLFAVVFGTAVAAAGVMIKV